ncbi:MAG: M23 family metallopeptidase [Gemmatimonadaceae bacterium]|nr:M23 family metallopeptidase [Gemmatimonadaceae bacterium]
MSRLLLAVTLLVVTACSRGGAAMPPATAPSPAPSPGADKPPAMATVIGRRPEYRSPRDDAVTDADLDALWERQLMVPVENLSRLSLRDDFSAKRGDRIHGALDLLAPRYTAVLASDDCVIGRLFTGPVGGIVVYATDLSERFVYYYAHLQRYRRGLAVGDRVAKGSVIGYVGTTGNAPPDTPHLHFQVMKRAPGRVWWDGPSINPLSFFAFDGVRP